jgi:hypothetical protein
MLAGVAGGVIGAFLGSSLGNFIMMRDIYKNINTSARVRDDARMVQERIVVQRPNFDTAKYKSDHNLGPEILGRNGYNYRGGPIALNPDEIGNDYLEFRRTLFHELGHEYQEQYFGSKNWAKLYSGQHKLFGGSLTQNIFEVQAERFANVMMNYSPLSSAFQFVHLPGLAGLTSIDLRKIRLSTGVIGNPKGG